MLRSRSRKRKSQQLSVLHYLCLTSKRTKELTARVKTSLGLSAALVSLHDLYIMALYLFFPSFLSGSPAYWSAGLLLVLYAFILSQLGKIGNGVSIGKRGVRALSLSSWLIFLLHSTTNLLLQLHVTTAATNSGPG